MSQPHLDQRLPQRRLGLVFLPLERAQQLLRRDLAQPQQGLADRHGFEGGLPLQGGFELLEVFHHRGLDALQRRRRDVVGGAQQRRAKAAVALQHGTVAALDLVGRDAAFGDEHPLGVALARDFGEQPQPMGRAPVAMAQARVHRAIAQLHHEAAQRLIRIARRRTQGGQPRAGLDAQALDLVEAQRQQALLTLDGHLEHAGVGLKIRQRTVQHAPVPAFHRDGQAGLTRQVRLIARQARDQVGLVRDHGMVPR